MTYTGHSSMKVLIADPQSTVRHALSVWISGQPGWDVVGEAGNSSDLLEKMVLLSPEVVILDRDLPGTPAGELVTQLRRVAAELVIILLTSSPLEALACRGAGCKLLCQ